MSIKRDKNRQGSYKVGGDSEERAPFTDRFTHSFQVGVLQIPQPAVDDLVIVGRCSVGKVALIHQGHSEAPERCFPGHTGPINPPADNYEIKFLSRKC